MPDNRPAGPAASPPVRRAWPLSTAMAHFLRPVDCLMWLQDLRCAARTLSRRPGLTAGALLTLAVGIGANTAIFSVIETVLINPLPYRDADRLVYLYQENLQRKISTTPSAELIRACRQQAGSFEQVETYATQAFNLTGEGEPALLVGARVSPGLFSLLGVEPPLGRTFAPGEDRSGEDRVMVLGHGLWQSRFGGDPEALGRSLVVDGEPHQIVGVLPPELRLEAYREIRFWIPQVADIGMDDDDAGPVYAIARLMEGVSVAAAQAEIEAISKRLEKPEAGGGHHGLAAIELTGRVVTPRARLDARMRTAILVLQAAVGFVLLIACANVANLLLAQGESRFQELAVRSVLGAGRGRLLRQLLTESLVLSALGGALGLLLSMWGIETIISLLPERLSYLERLRLNGTHLGFTLLVALATGVVFGLLPALRGSLPDLNETLKNSATGSGKRRTLLRQGLVAAEVALSLMLLIGAGLLVKTFVRMQNVDPGFAAQDLLTLRLELPEIRYPDASRQAAFFQELRDSLADLEAQHAEAVTLTSGIGTGLNLAFGRPELEGSPVAAEQPPQLMPVVTGMPGYFQTLDIPLRRGRGFTGEDREGAEPVVVVSEALARRLPAENLVGRRVRFNDDWYRIVGIAADVRLPAMGTKLSSALVYFPAAQSPAPAMTIAVRTKADQGLVVEAMKTRIWAIDQQVPVTGIASGRELLADSLAAQRFNAVLMTLLAAIAAMLVAVGIYGVVAYSVSQRTREIGIRVALGAGSGDVLRQVVRQGMLPVAAGIVAGLTGALALAGILASLLQDVSVRDPATFGAVSLMVAAITLAAILLPARQAARVEPMAALRHE